MGVGDQGDLVRDYFAHEVDEGGNRVPFDVEFGFQERTDGPYVGVTDVALVGAGMDGDALRAEAFAVQGRLRHVGQIAAAGVAEGGELIDVDTEPGHNLGY